MVSVEQYKTALSEIRQEGLLIHGLEMLKAHYRAPHHTISALQLALAVGKTEYGYANSTYGKFAHRVSDIVGIIPEERYEDGTPVWTYMLADGYGPKRHGQDFQWVMRPNLAEAMVEIGMVDRMIVSDALDDLDARAEKVAGLTEKERLAYQKARIGQGVFRDRVINYWGGCAVTGCREVDLLIASHIKPWRDCEVEEAYDMPNGLLLVPNLDKVFDKGFITFEFDGRIRLSPQLKPKTAEALGITETLRLRKELTDYHCVYLKHHHDEVFRKTV